MSGHHRRALACASRQVAGALAAAGWAFALLVPFAALAVMPGCGGSGPGSTLTVEGRVLAPGDFPAAGVTVASQGQEAVTDFDGRFRLEGVVAPYDLLLASAEGDGWLHVIEGLTAADPVVGARWARLEAAGMVELSGSLAAPVPAGRSLWINVEGIGASAAVAPLGRVGEGGDDFSMTVFLLGEGPVPARLRALELSTDGYSVVAFHGYATVDVTLVAGAPATADLPPLAPVATAELTGTIVPPGGGQLWLLAVDQVLGPQAVVPLARPEIGPQPAAVAQPVPLLGLGTRLVAGAAVGQAGSFAWRTFEEPAFGSLALPAPPQPLLPADGALSVTATTAFAVATASDGVVTFVWEAVTGGPDLALTTRRREATLPDLALAGLALPPGAAYRWTVEAADPAVAAAAATLASQEALFTALQPIWLFGVALPPDGELGVSARRGFTLAP
jgi:hypothetical protein